MQISGLEMQKGEAESIQTAVQIVRLNYGIKKAQMFLTSAKFLLKKHLRGR